MSVKPKYLGHVNLFVRDAERSKKWYEDVLGLHTYEYRPGWAAFMSADREQSHEVALMQLGPQAPLQQKGQVGLNHMAWRLDSLEDLKEFYQHIKELNVPIGRVADHGISLGIYLRDPDGNGVEVYYEMPRAEWPHEEHVFTRELMGDGRFPGPWDAELRSPARRCGVARCIGPCVLRDAPKALLSMRRSLPLTGVRKAPRSAGSRAAAVSKDPRSDPTGSPRESMR